MGLTCMGRQPSLSSDWSFCPEMVSAQVDGLPAERGRMGEQLARDRFAALPQKVEGAGRMPVSATTPLVAERTRRLASSTLPASRPREITLATASIGSRPSFPAAISVSPRRASSLILQVMDR